MNFKPPETDDEARTVKTSSSVSVRHNKQDRRYSSKHLRKQASVANDSTSKLTTCKQAHNSLFIERARSCSSLLTTEKCRRNCLKRAITARYQQMFHTAGRQRRMIRMSNGEPNNKGKHEALQTEARLLTSGKQVIQKRSGNRPQAIIHYPATRAQVKPSENHKACNKRCIALAVW
jgi:hypothetical protein